MLDTSNELPAEALAHADRAVALQPNSPTGLYAQMLARYYDGRPDAAILSGRRANALNPFDARIDADLGAILFLTGQYDEGLSLISQANRIGDRQFSGEILAFDAYRQGNYFEALRRLQDVDTPKSYLGRLLMIATLARRGKMDQASGDITILRRSYPGFESGFSTDMDFRSIAPSLVASLIQGTRGRGP